MKDPKEYAMATIILIIALGYIIHHYGHCFEYYIQKTLHWRAMPPQCMIYHFAK